MLDIIREDWMARLAKYRSEKLELSSPEILYVSTDGTETPEFARATVTDLPSDGGRKNAILLRGSRFFDKDAADAGGVDPGYRGARADYATEEGDVRALYSSDDPTHWKDSIIPVADALLMTRTPSRFAAYMIGLRDKVGPGKLIYAPGAADPLNLALLCYFGVDLVDSFGTLMRSSMGQVVINGRIMPSDAEELERIPGVGLNPDQRKVMDHNLRTLEDELAVVRGAIRTGSLRQLVELRARQSAWMIEALRYADLNEYSSFEQWVPVIGGEFLASSKESFWRPDIRRYRDRFMHRYVPPASPKVLVLMPCSARKPYSLSKTHKAFRNSIWNSGIAPSVHEVIVTSPLGVVPRELEIVYPAQQYDIPVTGHWDEDEKAMVREMLSNLLEKTQYEHIVAHLDVEYEFLAELLEEAGAIHTGGENVNSRESLSKLEGTLKAKREDVKSTAWNIRTKEDIGALASYQFGGAEKDLLDGASVRGNYPMIKVLRGDEQLCSLVADKGGLSLTLEGAVALSKSGRFAVEIDDFVPKTNIFAVGIEGASPEIRIGDEVYVHHRGEVRAVGTARMNGRSMVSLERGEAVHIRHHR